MADIIDMHGDKVIPEPNSGCWLWTATLTSTDMKKAYGWVHNHKSRLAHRLSYELSCDEIPAGMNVLHRCDNHLCVNPDHLFIGTQKDNVADCAKKGRRAIMSGASHPRARLTVDDVEYIRSIPSPTPRGAICALVEKFSLSRTQIKDIRAGRSWKATSEKQTHSP